MVITLRIESALAEPVRIGTGQGAQLVPAGGLLELRVVYNPDDGPLELRLEAVQGALEGEELA